MTVKSGAALGMAVLVGLLVGSQPGQAQPSDDRDRIKQGFAIAPVPLNLAGLDQNLVGLGSYIVNAVSDCNACHNAGPGNNQFLKGGNPYFSQPKKINPATYMGGGRNFGPFVPGSADIITRNLTPDKTGLPEGGRTFAEFVRVIRTGADLDNHHPTCPVGVLNTGCVPPPFDGSLLQIMPWFNFQDMNDHDLAAIYEYLRAIPCVAGPADPTDLLHNDCPAPPGGGGSGVTIKVTGPGGATSATNSFTTVSNQISLNASLSTSSNAGALTYSWTSAPGFPPVGIVGGNTATPSFQLLSQGTYAFILTVTDATGLKATATITVAYI